MAISRGGDEDRLICLRAWIWALEYFYVSLATVWGQGCKNDVIITIIVYVANPCLG